MSVYSSDKYSPLNVKQSVMLLMVIDAVLGMGRRTVMSSGDTNIRLISLFS